MLDFYRGSAIMVPVEREEIMNTKTYIVEYTDEDCIGNQCRTMTVQAESLDEAYAMLDWSFTELAVNTVYLAGAEYADL